MNHDGLNWLNIRKLWACSMYNVFQSNFNQSNYKLHIIQPFNLIHYYYNKTDRNVPTADKILFSITKKKSMLTLDCPCFVHRFTLCRTFGGKYFVLFFNIIQSFSSLETSTTNSTII